MLKSWKCVDVWIRTFQEQSGVEYGDVVVQ